MKHRLFGHRPRLDGLLHRRLRRRGQTLAQGLTTAMHLGSFYDAMRCLITTQQGNIFPDDVFIFNDPYVAAGQHLPDIYIIKPIFYEEQLVGVGDHDRASLRCRRHRAGLERARRDRDLSGRHPHPDREVHGSRQAGRSGLAIGRAQRAAARSADGRSSGPDGGMHRRASAT